MPLNYDAPINAKGERAIDSGFTRERRDLYHKIGQPYGTRTSDYVRWLSLSRVDRDGNFAGGRTIRVVEHLDGFLSYYIDGRFIDRVRYPSDEDFLKQVLGALGAKYEYIQETEETQREWDHMGEEQDNAPE